jgi:hypothetical protein
MRNGRRMDYVVLNGKRWVIWWDYGGSGVGVLVMASGVGIDGEREGTGLRGVMGKGEEEGKGKQGKGIGGKGGEKDKR